MERRIFAEINFDEDVSSRYAEVNGYKDDGPISTVEREFGWLEQSGITLKNAVLADDDCDLWSRYLYYLMGWAMARSYGDEPESPLSWDQYKNREENGPIALISPRYARTLIADLGSGSPTQNGERTTAYRDIMVGRGENQGKTVRVSLVERDNYYDLHVINDVSTANCELLSTEEKSEDSLYALLKKVLSALERGDALN